MWTFRVIFGQLIKRNFLSESERYNIVENLTWLQSLKRSEHFYLNSTVCLLLFKVVEAFIFYNCHQVCPDDHIFRDILNMSI